jgi:hypothetical protein
VLDEHRLEGDPPNRGWNRASLIFWSRKPYKPRISREDLALPKHLDGVRLLASCVTGAAAMTAFFVWMPLFLFTIFEGLSRMVFGIVIGSAFAALTCVLYVMVLRAKRV